MGDVAGHLEMRGWGNGEGGGRTYLREVKIVGCLPQGVSYELGGFPMVRVF